MKEKNITNCLGCMYYYVTWDNKFPKGCKYFGFKTNKMPSLVVKESSGESCQFYTAKIKD